MDPSKYKLYHFFEKNLTKAVELYTKSAEKGNSAAMNNLGYCFEHGIGVEKNLTKAVEWYTKSAEKGHYWGMYNLGRCFEHGNGVALNLATALEWYAKARDAGDERAEERINIVRENL